MDNDYFLGLFIGVMMTNWLWLVITAIFST